MSPRFVASLGALALVSLAPVGVAGQAPAKAKTAAMKTWTPPRTPEGQPNLQGIWNYAPSTPLERPTAFAGKQFLTDDELAQAEKGMRERNSRDRRDGVGTDADVNRDYNEFWEEKRETIILTRQTSLVTDPPDGRLPPLTQEAQKREAARAEARRGRGPFDSWEDRPLQERCLVNQTAGPPILPVPGKESLLGHVFNFQIFQTPGHVVILQESYQQLRIISLDGRPHIGQNIRQWLGDSRGRWEGNTLVVDTTNFTDKTNFRGWSNENLHLVERFTRVDADTIDYQFTVDDPTTWTKPWSAAVPMAKSEGPIFEYACHEGNHSLVNILSGARAEEKAAEEAAREGSR